MCGHRAINIAPNQRHDDDYHHHAGDDDDHADELNNHQTDDYLERDIQQIFVHNGYKFRKLICV